MVSKCCSSCIPSISEDGDWKQSKSPQAWMAACMRFPDPVHHVRGAVFENVKSLFRHTLGSIQKQVQVQVTRALDLDFAAQIFWRNAKGTSSEAHAFPSSFLARWWDRGAASQTPLQWLSPPQAPLAPGRLARACSNTGPAPSALPQTLTFLLHLGGIGGSKHIGQGSAQSRGHILREVIRVGFWWEESPRNQLEAWAQ